MFNLEIGQEKNELEISHTTFKLILKFTQKQNILKTKKVKINLIQS